MKVMARLLLFVFICDNLWCLAPNPMQGPGVSLRQLATYVRRINTLPQAQKKEKIAKLLNAHKNQNPYTKLDEEMNTYKDTSVDFRNYISGQTIGLSAYREPISNAIDASLTKKGLPRRSIGRFGMGAMQILELLEEGDTITYLTFSEIDQKTWKLTLFKQHEEYYYNVENATLNAPEHKGTLVILEKKNHTLPTDKIINDLKEHFCFEQDTVLMLNDEPVANRLHHLNPLPSAKNEKAVVNIRVNEKTYSIHDQGQGMSLEVLLTIFLQPRASTKRNIVNPKTEKNDANIFFKKNEKPSSSYLSFLVNHVAVEKIALDFAKQDLCSLPEICAIEFSDNTYQPETRDKLIIAPNDFELLYKHVENIISYTQDSLSEPQNNQLRAELLNAVAYTLRTFARRQNLSLGKIKNRLLNTKSLSQWISKLKGTTPIYPNSYNLSLHLDPHIKNKAIFLDELLFDFNPIHANMQKDPEDFGHNGWNIFIAQDFSSKTPVINEEQHHIYVHPDIYSAGLGVMKGLIDDGSQKEDKLRSLDFDINSRYRDLEDMQKNFSESGIDKSDAKKAADNEGYLLPFFEEPRAWKRTAFGSGNIMASEQNEVSVVHDTAGKRVFAPTFQTHGEDGWPKFFLIPYPGSLTQGRNLLLAVDSQSIYAFDTTRFPSSAPETPLHPLWIIPHRQVPVIENIIKTSSDRSCPLSIIVVSGKNAEDPQNWQIAISASSPQNPGVYLLDADGHLAAKYEAAEHATTIQALTSRSIAVQAMNLGQIRQKTLYERIADHRELKRIAQTTDRKNFVWTTLSRCTEYIKIIDEKTLAFTPKWQNASPDELKKLKPIETEPSSSICIQENEWLAILDILHEIQTHILKISLLSPTQIIVETTSPEASRGNSSYYYDVDLKTTNITKKERMPVDQSKSLKPSSNSINHYRCIWNAKETLPENISVLLSTTLPAIQRIFSSYDAKHYDLFTDNLHTNLRNLQYPLPHEDNFQDFLLLAGQIPSELWVLLKKEDLDPLLSATAALGEDLESRIRHWQIVFSFFQNVFFLPPDREKASLTFTQAALTLSKLASFQPDVLKEPFFQTLAQPNFTLKGESPLQYFLNCRNPQEIPAHLFTLKQFFFPPEPEASFALEKNPSWTAADLSYLIIATWDNETLEDIKQDHGLDILQNKVSDLVKNQQPDIQMTQTSIDQTIRGQVSADNEYVFLRELAQNVADAANEEIREKRIADIERKKMLQTLSVTIGNTMVNDKKALSIAMQDHIGIATVHDIVHFLLTPDSSSRLKQMNTGELLGMFGKGFFTVFQNADYVRIRTGKNNRIYNILIKVNRSQSSENQEQQTLSVENFSIETDPPFEQGTSIERITLAQESSSVSAEEQIAAQKIAAETAIDTFLTSFPSDTLSVIYNGLILNNRFENLQTLPVSIDNKSYELTIRKSLYADDRNKESLITVGGTYLATTSDLIGQRLLAALDPSIYRFFIQNGPFIIDLPKGIPDLLVSTRTSIKDKYITIFQETLALAFIKTALRLYITDGVITPGLPKLNDSFSSSFSPINLSKALKDQGVALFHVSFETPMGQTSLYSIKTSLSSHRISLSAKAYQDATTWLPQAAPSAFLKDNNPILFFKTIFSPYLELLQIDPALADQILSVKNPYENKHFWDALVKIFHNCEQGLPYDLRSIEILENMCLRLAQQSLPFSPLDTPTTFLADNPGLLRKTLNRLATEKWTKPWFTRHVLPTLKQLLTNPDIAPNLLDQAIATCLEILFAYQPLDKASLKSLQETLPTLSLQIKPDLDSSLIFHEIYRKFYSSRPPAIAFSFSKNRTHFHSIENAWQDLVSSWSPDREKSLRMDHPFFMMLPKANCQKLRHIAHLWINPTTELNSLDLIHESLDVLSREKMLPVFLPILFETCFSSPTEKTRRIWTETTLHLLAENTQEGERALELSFNRFDLSHVFCGDKKDDTFGNKLIEIVNDLDFSNDALIKKIMEHTLKHPLWIGRSNVDGMDSVAEEEENSIKTIKARQESLRDFKNKIESSPANWIQWCDEIRKTWQESPELGLMKLNDLLGASTSLSDSKQKELTALLNELIAAYGKAISNVSSSPEVYA